MTIREAEKVDAQALALLAKEIWTEYYIDLLGMAQVDYMLAHFQSREAIEQGMADGMHYFWIVQGNEPAGYFAVKPGQPAGKLFLSKLYIRQTMRGRGGARRVFAFLTELAREQGLHAVWLTVNKGNASVSKYQKLGLAVTDSVVTDIGGGFVMDDYIMEMAV